MKRLGYPIALVLLSLASVVFFTTVTAVTLASYSKSEKSAVSVTFGESETVRR